MLVGIEAGISNPWMLRSQEYVYIYATSNASNNTSKVLSIAIHGCCVVKSLYSDFYVAVESLENAAST
jgi:hypothetical protein